MLQQLTRALRRRTEREARKQPPVVETDFALVPKWPRHFHVCLRTYHGLGKDGQLLFATEFCSLVTNDVRLAASRAMQTSGRLEHHIDKVVECDDPAHVGPDPKGEIHGGS